jgi:hypothetical protein
MPSAAASSVLSSLYLVAQTFPVVSVAEPSLGSSAPLPDSRSFVLRTIHQIGPPLRSFHLKSQFSNFKFSCPSGQGVLKLDHPLYGFCTSSVLRAASFRAINEHGCPAKTRFFHGENSRAAGFEWTRRNSFHSTPPLQLSPFLRFLRSPSRISSRYTPANRNPRNPFKTNDGGTLC